MFLKGHHAFFVSQLIQKNVFGTKLEMLLLEEDLKPEFGLSVLKVPSLNQHLSLLVIEQPAMPVTADTFLLLALGSVILDVFESSLVLKQISDRDSLAAFVGINQGSFNSNYGIHFLFICHTSIK